MTSQRSRRPPAPPPTDTPNEDLTAELIRLYQQERLSLAAIADRHGRSADWVKLRLERAGVPLRPPGRRSLLDPEHVRRRLDDGWRVSQIAVEVGCSDTTVLEMLRQQGWTSPPRRTRGPSRNAPPPVDPDRLRELYIERGLTIAETAQALGSTRGRVSAALKAAQITARRPGWVAGNAPEAITADQIETLYVKQRKSIRGVAEELQCSTTRVELAIRRHGIQRRPEPYIPPEWSIDEPTLRALYVDQRLDDQAIGRRYKVAPYRVTLRRRELGVHRPPVGPPHPVPPAAPAVAELERLYLTEKLTLAEIGHLFHTSAPRVREWLVAAGLPVAPRTSREHRKALDPELLAHLYVERYWTAAEIASDQNSTIQLVLRTMHDHDIAVRRGGTRPAKELQNEPDPRLAALYSDPQIADLLRRHRIAQRPGGGPLAERFPTPAKVTIGFLRKAYVDLGLAAGQIEQLTGHPAERIRDTLRANGVALRGPGLSPWLLTRRPAARNSTSRTQK